MLEHAHPELFQSIQTIMEQRAHLRATLDQHVTEFTDRLFTAIETVQGTLEQAGVPDIGKSRRIKHPASGGQEGLQLMIEDWSIIFVPLLGIARPNSLDEARIAPAQFKEPCGRIAVFLTDDRTASAFYDFLIFQDRSWFAWGYGWPKQQSDIDNTNFEALALELLQSFVEDIFKTWYTRQDTSLEVALDAKKRAFEYGLPGEDIQGG
jgi:hypothetical protein